MLLTWSTFVTFLGLTAAASLGLTTNSAARESDIAKVTNFSANVTEEKVKNTKLNNSEYEVLIPLNITTSGKGSEASTLKLVREHDALLPLPISIISNSEVEVQTIPVQIIYEPIPKRFSPLTPTENMNYKNNTEEIKEQNRNSYPKNVSISTKLLPATETSIDEQIDKNTKSFKKNENNSSTVSNTTESVIVLETNSYTNIIPRRNITKDEVQSKKYELNLNSDGVQRSIQKYDVITTINETNTYKNDNTPNTYNIGVVNGPPDVEYDISNQAHWSENSSSVYNKKFPAVSTIQPPDKLYTNAPVTTITTNVQATILSAEVELPRQFTEQIVTKIESMGKNVHEDHENNTKNKTIAQALQQTILKSCAPLEQKVPISDVISPFDNNSSSDEPTLQVSLRSTINLPNVNFEMKSTKLISKDNSANNSSNKLPEVLTRVDDLLNELQKEILKYDTIVTETYLHKATVSKNNTYNRSMTKDLIDQDYDEYDVHDLMKTTSIETDVIVSTESTISTELTDNNLFTSTMEGDIESNAPESPMQTEEYYFYTTHINLPEPIVLSAELLKSDSIPTSDLLNVQNNSQELEDISTTIDLFELESTSTNKNFHTFKENTDPNTESYMVHEPDKTTELPHTADLIFFKQNHITGNNDIISLQQQKLENSTESAITTDFNYLEQNVDTSILTTTSQIVLNDQENQQDTTTETYEPTKYYNEIQLGNNMEFNKEKVLSPILNKDIPVMQIIVNNQESGSVSNVPETIFTTNTDLPDTATEQYITTETGINIEEGYSTNLSTSDLENIAQYTHIPMLFEKENKLQYPITITETIINPTISNEFKQSEPTSNPETKIISQVAAFTQSSSKVKTQIHENSVNAPNRVLHSKTSKSNSSHITNTSTRRYDVNTFNKYPSVNLDIPVAVVYDDVKIKQYTPTLHSQRKITQYESLNIAKNSEITTKPRLANNKKRGSIKYSDTVTRSFYEAITSAPTVRQIKRTKVVSEIPKNEDIIPKNKHLKSISMKNDPSEYITGDIEPNSRSHIHFKTENSLNKNQRGRARYRNYGFINRDPANEVNGIIRPIENQSIHKESVSVKSVHEIYKNEHNIKDSDLNKHKHIFPELSQKVNDENREKNLENIIKKTEISSEGSGLEYITKLHIKPLPRDSALIQKPTLVHTMFTSQEDISKIDSTAPSIKTEMQVVTTPSSITVRTSKNAGFINNVFEEHKLNNIENETTDLSSVVSPLINTNNYNITKMEQKTEIEHVSGDILTKLPENLDTNEVTTVSDIDETVDVKELRNEYIVSKKFISHQRNYFSSVYQDETQRKEGEAKLKNKFNHEDKTNFRNTNTVLENLTDTSKEKLSTKNADLTDVKSVSEYLISTISTNDDSYTIKTVTIQDDITEIVSTEATKVTETDSIQLEEAITLKNDEIISTTPASIDKPKKTRIPIRKIKRKLITTSDVIINEDDRDDFNTRNIRSTNMSNENNQKAARTKTPPVPIVTSDNRVYSHTGDFAYSYESGDGTRAFETGRLMKTDETRAGAAVQGGFSFKDATGEEYSVEYTADEGGYRPRGAHLPTPPPVPPAIARALSYLATLSTPPPSSATTTSVSSSRLI